MRTYIVYRYGANTANQPGTFVAVVGQIKSMNRKRALAEAQTKYDPYNNQRLTVRPVSRCSNTDLQEAAWAEYVYTAKHDW